MWLPAGSGKRASGFVPADSKGTASLHAAFSLEEGLFSTVIRDFRRRHPPNVAVDDANRRL
jgi:hypothetical protein